MGLLEIFEAAGHAREIYRLARGADPPDWSRDEEAFLHHFGATAEEYQEIVDRLDPAQQRLLEATLEVNPEAAVLWVLAMEEVA